MCIMRTTVDIDAELLRSAKRRAAARGQTLGGYLSDAIRADMAAADAPAAPVRLHTVGGGGLRPGIDPDSNRALWDVIAEDGDGVLK
jgi:hypothetical protein